VPILKPQYDFIEAFCFEDEKPLSSDMKIP